MVQAQVNLPFVNSYKCDKLKDYRNTAVSTEKLLGFCVPVALPVTTNRPKDSL